MWRPNPSGIRRCGVGLQRSPNIQRLHKSISSRDLGVSDPEPKFVCSACGKRGADVRPISTGTGRAHLPVDIDPARSD
jgi:hypothetical protein